MIQITSVRDLTIPLTGNISNAVVNFLEHTVSLVAVVSNQAQSGRTLVGVGFNSIGRFAQSGILRERFIPRILAADPVSLLAGEGTLLDPASVVAAAMCNEKPGGHGDRASALAALELAIWDLNAKLADEPAYIAIAKAFNRQVTRPTIATYAAGGYYYPEDSLVRLKEELEAYKRLGFDTFKIKVGGASLEEDLERIALAIETSGSGSRLAVDANGRFSRDEAFHYAEQMEPLELRWYEEPGDPLDFDLVGQLTAQFSTPIATGENLFSSADVRNLVRYGGMRSGKDIYQMDAGLSYGLTEYARMLDVLESAGFDRTQCFPHGGHLINLHIAIGLGLGGCEAYPGVFSPLGGFPDTCTIAGGVVTASEASGFGLEEKRELSGPLAQLLEGI